MKTIFIEACLTKDELVEEVLCSGVAKRETARFAKDEIEETKEGMATTDR